MLLEHIHSPLAPLAWLQAALSPLQERFIGCHLDRPTLETARTLGLAVEEVATRVAGIFRLAVATPPQP